MHIPTIANDDNKIDATRPKGPGTVTLSAQWEKHGKSILRNANHLVEEYKEHVKTMRVVGKRLDTTSRCGLEKGEQRGAGTDGYNNKFGIRMRSKPSSDIPEIRASCQHRAN